MQKAEYLQVVTEFNSSLEQSSGRVKSRALKPMLDKLTDTLSTASPSTLNRAASDLPSELLPALFSVLSTRVELFAPPHSCSPALVILAERAGNGDGEHLPLAQAMFDSLASRLSAVQKEAITATLEREQNGLPTERDQKWLEATIGIVGAGVKYPGADMKAVLHHYYLFHELAVDELDATQACRLAIALSGIVRQKNIGRDRDALTRVINRGLTLCGEMSEQQVIYLLRAAAFGKIRPPQTSLTTALSKFNSGLEKLDDKLFSQLLGALTYFKVTELGEEACSGLVKRSSLSSEQAWDVMTYVSLCRRLSDSVLGVLRGNGRVLSMQELSQLSLQDIHRVMLILPGAARGPVSQCVAGDLSVILQRKSSQLSSAMSIDCLFTVLKLSLPMDEIRGMTINLLDRSLAERDSLEPEHIARMSSIAAMLKRRDDMQVAVTKATQFFRRGQRQLGQLFGRSPSVESMFTVCVNLMQLRLQHTALLEAMEPVILRKLRSLSASDPMFLLAVLRSQSLLSYPLRNFMMKIADALFEANAVEQLSLVARINLGWVLMNSRLATHRTGEMVRRAMNVEVHDIMALPLTPMFELQEMNWRAQVFTRQWAGCSLQGNAVRMLRSRLKHSWRFGGGVKDPTVRRCVEQLESIVSPEALLCDIIVYPGIPVQCALLLDENFQLVSWQDSGVMDFLHEKLPPLDGCYHLVAIYFLWDKHVLTTADQTASEDQPLYSDRKSSLTGATRMYTDSLDACNWHAFFFHADEWLQTDDKMAFLDAWRVELQLSAPQPAIAEEGDKVTKACQEDEASEQHLTLGEVLETNRDAKAPVAVIPPQINLRQRRPRKVNKPLSKTREPTNTEKRTR